MKRKIMELEFNVLIEEMRLLAYLHENEEEITYSDFKRVKEALESYFKSRNKNPSFEELKELIVRWMIDNSVINFRITEMDTTNGMYRELLNSKNEDNESAIESMTEFLIFNHKNSFRIFVSKHGMTNILLVNKKQF